MGTRASNERNRLRRKLRRLGYPPGLAFQSDMPEMTFDEWRTKHAVNIKIGCGGKCAWIQPGTSAHVSANQKVG